jgi:hypothetical protein
MQFPPTSYYFSLLGPNILLSTPFSNTLSLYSSFNVRDQVSYPYKTTGKIIVNLIFTFLDRREVDVSRLSKHIIYNLPSAIDLYGNLLKIGGYRLQSRHQRVIT